VRRSKRQGRYGFNGTGGFRVRVPLFVGRQNGLGVRARRGARRDSRAAGVRGRRKRREEGGADGWGQRAKKTGEEARLGLADGDGLAADVEAGIGRWEAEIGRWGQAGSAKQKQCEGKERVWFRGAADVASWTDVGRGGENRPQRKGKERVADGLLADSFFLISFSFLFKLTPSYLNSNEIQIQT
jgi:hypothetical protein